MKLYLAEIKRNLRDQYQLKPTGGTKYEPVFADGVIPDGKYPMVIDGKKLVVICKDGKFSF